VGGIEARAREAVADLGLELRREADLGHQEERLAALAQDFGDEVQVDLGLAAAGHAVKQDRAEACPARRSFERAAWSA
jgi:hypothetical protein